MHGWWWWRRQCLHSESDVHRIYLLKDKRRGGLIKCKDCIRSEENSLGWYLRNSSKSSLVDIMIKVASLIEAGVFMRKEKFTKTIGTLQFLKDMDKEHNEKNC